MSRKSRRVAIVGSTTFPLTPEIGAEVVDIMRGYPDGTVFLTRGSSGFDTFISRASDIIGRTCVLYPSPGGSRNWDRDVALVKDADEVLLFFDPASLHDPNTGTAHVGEKALDQRKKVMAYSVANERLIYAGSSE